MLNNKPKYEINNEGSCDKFILHAVNIDWYFCIMDRDIRWRKRNNSQIVDAKYCSSEEKTIKEFVRSLALTKY